MSGPMTVEAMVDELENTAVELDWLFRDGLWKQRADAGIDSDDNQTNPQARIGNAVEELMAAARLLKGGTP